MEIKDIKPLFGSPIAAELSEQELIDRLKGAMVIAFMLSGLNGSKSVDELKEEVSFYSKQLCLDIKNEPKFKSLRVAEINFCFTNGVHNEFDDKKIGVYGLNYKSFYIWLDVYMSLEIRKAAWASYFQDKNASSKKLTQHNNELPKNERDVIMRTSINKSFQNYLHNTGNEILDFSSSISKALYQQQGQKSGEIRDLGRAKYNYLSEAKMIKNNEDLKGFYERMKNEGREAIFND